MKETFFPQFTNYRSLQSVVPTYTLFLTSCIPSDSSPIRSGLNNSSGALYLEEPGYNKINIYRLIVLHERISKNFYINVSYIKYTAIRQSKFRFICVHRFLETHQKYMYMTFYRSGLDLREGRQGCTPQFALVKGDAKISTNIIAVNVILISTSL